jgi:hypothetical protein
LNEVDLVDVGLFGEFDDECCPLDSNTRERAVTI